MYMVGQNAVIGQFAGTSIGALQTPLLREYVDTATPWVGGIGAYGRPSALIGLISGLLTLGIGIYGSTKNRSGEQRIKSDGAVLALIGHGTVAFETGLLSGMLPAPKTATVGGMGESQYVAPGSQSMGDMNMLNSMSAELNRLQTENMQLKSMQTGTYPAAIPQGSVVNKQLRYGFMEPTPQEYIAPGQPTRAARELGFMERTSIGRARNPLVKVQDIAGRSGFLG
jgi:hypothetical protein